MRYRLMATYRGVPYEVGLGPSNSDVVLFAACPPPEELGFEPATGHWRKPVIRAEIDTLWESRPVGIFRGEPCMVLDDPGERLHIAYLGTDAERATSLGYWQVDRGVFELLTPREEVAELTEEWETNGPQIDPLISSFGVIAGQFLGDAVTHEHDIRGALDAPGARDSEGLAIGFAWLGARVGEMRDGAEAGALRVETEAGPYTFGSGPPTETCATSRFDFVRASTGRRSVEQIAAWDWDGEPRPELLVMPIFAPRPDPLIE